MLSQRVVKQGNENAQRTKSIARVGAHSKQNVKRKGSPYKRVKARNANKRMKMRAERQQRVTKTDDQETSKPRRARAMRGERHAGSGMKTKNARM